MIVGNLHPLAALLLVAALSAGDLRADDGPPPLTMDNLLQLAAAQFGTEEILAQVRERGLAFQLDDQALARLIQGGVSDELAAGLTFTVADAHLGKGQFELARSYFELTLKRAPKHALSYFGLGLVAKAQGDLPQAVRWFSKALDIDPSLISVYLQRGEVLGQLKQFSDAERDYREAMRVSGGAPLPLIRLADLLARCPDSQIRNPSEALKLALQACRATEFQHAAALDVLAAAYAASGDMPQAVKYQAAALQSAPDGLKPLYAARLDAYRAGQSAPQISVAAAQPARPNPAGSILEGIFKKMVELPGGEFSMGAEGFEDDERPVHTVRVQPFRISKTEVTRREWCVVWGVPLEEIREPDLPLDGLAWEDAQAFVSRLNSLPGGAGLRLPSEAEWEYAARGGATLKYGYADDAAGLDSFAWHKGNSEGRLHVGAQRRPNPFGLFDLFGNCAEWCQDTYNPYGQEGLPSRLRVLRGGGYSNTAALCRASARGTAPQDERRRGFGVRLAANAVASAASGNGNHATGAGARETRVQPTSDIDAKIESLQSRLNAKPEDKPTRQLLCKLLAERFPVRHKERNYKIALSDLEQLIELDVEAFSDAKAAYHRTLAWIQATCPIAELRDAHSALEHAEMACALTQWVDWRSLIAIAAAQAELGHFADAVRRAGEAVAMATADVATPEERSDCTRQLKAFQDGKPWREGT